MRSPELAPFGIDLVLRVTGGGADQRDAGPMSGWTTPQCEAARLQRDHGGDLVSGGAFGRPWPVVIVGQSSVVAPAVPVRVTSQPTEGPDGAYVLADGAVWRATASGRERLVDVATADDPPGEPVDLLWFADTTRWLVQGGVLEVSDAFSRLTLPVSMVELERLLVRTRRVDPSVLDGLPYDAPTRDRARLEVWRETELLDPSDITDPQGLLGRRPEVARIERRGDVLIGADVDDAPIEMDLVNVTRAGWTIERRAGRLPFEQLRLEACGPRVLLSADLVAAIDCLEPGVRQRIAFDLFADLVAVDRDRGQKR